MAYKQEYHIGDVSVSHNEHIGGSLTVQGNTKLNGNVKIEGFLECEHIKDKVKGFFATEDDLKKAYPTPKAGWIAIVGNSIPGTIYRVQNEAWFNTTIEGGQIFGDVELYKAQVEELRELIAMRYAESITGLKEIINDDNVLQVPAVDGTIATLDDVGNLEEVVTKKLDDVNRDLRNLEQFEERVVSSYAGITFSHEDGLRVDTARGVRINKDDLLEVDIEPQMGLMFDGNSLAVNAGNGLKYDNDGSLAIDFTVAASLGDVSEEMRQRLAADTALGNRISSETSERQQADTELQNQIDTIGNKYIKTIDISELDTLTAVPIVTTGKADYWVTTTYAGQSMIVGRLFLIEDSMMHKSTQVLLTNSTIEGITSGTHLKEGVNVFYRFYGHTSVDVPMKQWTEWKVLFDSENPAKLEAALESLQTNIDQIQEIVDLFPELITQEVDNAMPSAPKVSGVEKGTHTFPQNSCIPDRVVFLSDMGCFAAVQGLTYYSNWSAKGEYSSAQSYGKQNGGAPVPVVGRLYLFGDNLKRWDGSTFVEVSVSGNVEVTAENLIKTTYAELKQMRDEAKLNAGTFYRITDYVTTTTQSETKSANHPFDVIVLALSENTLSEDAKAALHEDDTYFADSDLGAWELKYCLDNDSTRFAWADKTNGKGVIYRMVDEKRNDCPYDFKNILFYNTKLTSGTTSDKYYYTFSYAVSGVLYDGTTEKQVKNCYGNVIGEYRNSGVLKLNKNVFRNTVFNYSCYYNTFGNYCNSNTFGNSCNYNTFGNSCYSNTFGNYCYSNTFGNSCYSNTFGNYCYSNTFGDYCYSNTFGDSCYYNTFGNYCNSNTFGDNCYYNTFGDSCYSNTFGNYCNSNTFGDSCYSNTFGNYCNSNTFGDNCYYNTFGDYLQNHSLDTNKTSLTHNEEFYDDGSGQLVPIKHPDLSTQPSILPYKFMGQYVYEQLIPVDVDLINNSIYKIKWLDCAVDKPLILEGFEIVYGLTTVPDRKKYPASKIYAVDYISYDGFEYDGVNSTSSTIISVSQNPANLNVLTINGAYLKIVYTSMPGEDSSYYGYNNYGGG